MPERLQNYLAGTMNAEISGSTLKVSPLGDVTQAPAVYLPDAQQPAGYLSRDDGQYYSQDLLKAIETAGVNGATEQLLASYQESIQDLLDSGEISQEEASLLFNLANQGHKMAAIERLIEDAAAAATSQDHYNSMRIEYNGQLYDPTTLLKENLGYHKWTDDMAADPLFLTQGKAYSRGETATYIEMYHDLKNKGALGNPNVEAIVTRLSREIVVLSENLDHANSYVTGEGTPQEMRDRAHSIATDIHSAGVCHTGGGKDSGSNCSGG